jgi:hypothetical protein
VFFSAHLLILLFYYIYGVLVVHVINFARFVVSDLSLNFKHWSAYYKIL